MIKRFLEVKEALKTTCTLLKMDLSGIDFKLMEELSASLEPIVVAVEKLQTSNTNILEGETILELLSQRLEQLNSKISLSLLSFIKIRHCSRRNKPLITLVKFLQNPNLFCQKTEYFEISGKSATQKLAKSLVEKFFDQKLRLIEPSSNQNTEMSFKEQIESALNKLHNFDSICTTPTGFQKEFSLYEAKGFKPENLILLTQALNQIQATSSESERVLSTSSTDITKIRSRLSPKPLNFLVFLKYYFQRS